MSGFLERLAGRRCVLLDGGLGSMLHRVSVWESDTSRATYIQDADG